MGSAILGYFTRHPTAANLLMAVMLVVGIAAAPQMRSQFFPDVVMNDITVKIKWDGAGPTDVDRALIEPLLPTLMALEGLNNSSAVSIEGAGTVTLQFEPGTDMAQALDNVQTAVDSVSTLPAEAEQPVIERKVWRDRVTDVVISGPVGIDQLARFGDDLVARLFSEGVTRTTLRGVANPETVVEARSIDLMRHDVTMQELAKVIADAASTTPAGDISGGSTRVRTGTERRAVDQIAALPVRILADGSVLTVGDVAQVIDTGVDRNSAFFVDGNPALSIRVDRSPEGDAIAIQKQVEAVAAEMKLTLPPEMRIDLTRSRSKDISGRLNLLYANGLQGLALVLVLLFLFLNARTALWVAAGIPVSLLTALALMNWAGMTINMMSLFGLIITLGIIVDDAIVVGEHADHRFRNLGESPYVAAERGVRHMFLPVISATATTIIAFWGLTFVGGRFGEMIQDIPFTVTAVLAASTVEAILILPNHMAHALASQAGGRVPWYDRPSMVVNRVFDWFRERWFRPFMLLVLRARYPVLAGALLLFAVQLVPLITGDLSWRFFVGPEQSSISTNFAMLPGATRADTVAQMQELQHATSKVAADFEAEFGKNPLAHVLTQIGGNTGQGLPNTESKDDDLLGSVAIELIDSDERPYSAASFLSALQKETQQLPLTETLSLQAWRFGPQGGNLTVQLFGADAVTLKASAEALKTRLAQYPEITSVDDDLAYDKDEFVLELTPNGQALGFTTDDLARLLRERLNGIEATTYPSGLRSGAIRVELPERERQPDFLESIMLRSAAGQYVPLTDLVTVAHKSGFGHVRRRDGLLVVNVSAELNEDDAARAALVEGELRDTVLPEFGETQQVEWRLAGLADDQNRFFADAQTGFIMCLLGIYLILAWIFASWTRPLIIMAIIPFGLVGALWGHQLWGMALSMFSIVGLIGMSGIIINDSIVLISTIDERSESRGLWPAIIDGTCERLRPVLLTTLTTVLGLVPLLYDGSRQSEFLKPTVVTLVYGLSFGMLLVLALVPALLAAGQDLSLSMASLRRAVARRRGGGAVLAWVYGGLAAFWFAVTLGSWIATGGAWAPLQAVLIAAGLPIGPGLASAYLIFAAGAVLIGLVVFLGAVTVRLRQRGRAVAAE